MAVIMSVYRKDRPEFVKQAVRSIIDQTFSQFHYYIVYDGKIDQEVENFISSINDSRLRIFRLEENVGIAPALNFLLGIVLKNPEIEFIARMDADDISSLVRFETQYNFLQTHKEISIVGSWYKEIDQNGCVISDRQLPVSNDMLVKRYYKLSPFPHSSVMYRRSLIEQAGFYPTDTILMEDNALWGKSIYLGLKLANIPEYLLNYRIDSGFYRRRSGLKYGWNFILTKFKINRKLDFPLYTYFIVFLIGIIKMFPPVLLQRIYSASRKF